MCDMAWFFMDLASALCSEFVITVLHAILHYIQLFYNKANFNDNISDNNSYLSDNDDIYLIHGAMNHCTKTGIKTKSTKQDLLTDITQNKLKMGSTRLIHFMF